MSKQSVTFWQIFYVSSSLFIKTSICVQLLRIASNKLCKLFLWCLIALTVLITLTAMIVGLVRCQPLAASWDPSLGTCMDQGILVILTYVVSGMNILIDWSVAIVPVIILWDVQMHRTLKIMANLVMGIGAL